MNIKSVKHFLFCAGVWWFAVETQCSFDDPARLRAVLMITRHGARTPFFNYPLDPHRKYDWPGGRGALTSVGASQLFVSGSQKLERYSSLLESIPIDNPSDITNYIKVISSASSRCVESAVNFMKPFSPVQFPSNSIDTTPVEEDEILGIGKPCAYYELTLKKGSDFDDPDVLDFINRRLKSGESILSYIERKTGLKIKSLVTLLFLADTLKVEQEHGLPMPDWVFEIPPEYFNDLSKVIFYKLSTSRYMEIHTGGLIRDIFERMDKLIAGKSRQNIVLYSGHDMTISSVLHALNTYSINSTMPLYGATISIELRENSQVADNLEVKVLYFRDFEDTIPINIRIPFCKEPCPYRIFKKVLKPKCIYNYEAECNK